MTLPGTVAKHAFRKQHAWGILHGGRGRARPLHGPSLPPRRGKILENICDSVISAKHTADIFGLPVLYGVGSYLKGRGL